MRTLIKFVKMTLVGGLTVGLPIWLTGCAGVGRRGTKVEQAVISAGRTSTVTEEELRERLRDFGKRFGLRIEGTALQIGEQTQENRVRLVATYWKLLAIPYCQDAILHPDVRTALP